MIKPFHFKQFSVFDDQSTMKVNTDGVLLGCFIDPPLSGKALEIGCGSGFISLMVAQKFNGSLLAIDIDEPSCKQAEYNFSISDWGDRLNVLNSDVRLLDVSWQQSFSFIFSNPPYHSENILNTDHRRRIARHTCDLPFSDLLASASKLLEDKGSFDLIIPFSAYSSFIEISLKYSFSICRVMKIVPVHGKLPNRVLISMKKNLVCLPSFEELTIRDINRNFTNEYKNFVSDYYLDFPY